MEERIRQIGDLLDLNHDDTTFQEGFWPTAAPVCRQPGEHPARGA